MLSGAVPGSYGTQPDTVWNCSALGNTTLRFAIERHFPFYKDTNQGRPEGVDAELIRALSESLKFRYTLTKPPDGKWGTSINGSWNGMIGMVMRKEVDAAAGGMTVLPDRYDCVSFTSSYLNDRATFVVKSPSKLNTANIISKPFSTNVWVVLAAAGGLCALFLLARNWVTNNGKATTDSVNDYFSTVVQIYSILVGQGIRDPKCPTRRLILGLWMLFAITLSAGYSGKLISYMANPGLSPAVDTVAKLVQSIEAKEFTCGTIKDAAEYAMLKNDNSTVARTLLQSMESDPRNFVKSDKQGLKNCLERNYAYLGGEITVDADMKDERLFLFGKDSFLEVSYSIAFQKGFPCLHKFNDRILRLQSSGLPELWQDHAILRGRERTYYEESGYEPLSIAKLQGPFVLLAVGLVLSLAVAVAERLLARFEPRGCFRARHRT